MDKCTSETVHTNVYVALGSNLGDRLQHLRYGVDALQRVSQVELVSVSPVYESPAQTTDPTESQPLFLNAVVEIKTSLDPHSLLDHCQRIERETGRIRDARRRWYPRTLDLDLLIFGSEVVRDARLSVPHPKLDVRRFVLRPLADLAPGLHVPPPYDAPVGTLLDACPDDNDPVLTRFSLPIPK